MKKWLLLLYLFAFTFSSVYAADLELPAVYIEDYDSYADKPIVITPPSYTSGAVVIMDAVTGLVLYGHQTHTPFYPASVTKVMTALLVLEHIEDLDERISFSYNAVWSIPRLSTHIYMDVGETLSVYEALHALLLSSANEVSIALAEHVAGSVDVFVDLMNRRAAQLGAVNTHFVNPSGLHAPGHVSTAYDSARIMRAAIQFPLFKQIINTATFEIPPTERQPEARPLLNTNRMVRNEPEFNEDVIGGKTGWTPMSGHTLVTYAQQNNRRLIVSVLRQAERGGTFSDTTQLLNYGFSLPFEDTLVFEAAGYTQRIPVYYHEEGVGYVTLQAEQDLSFALPIGFDRTHLRYDLHVPSRVSAPVMQGDPLGRLVVYVQNIRVGEQPLLATSSVFRPAHVYEYETTPYAPETSYVPTPSYTYEQSPRTIWQELMENEYIQTFMLPAVASAVGLIVSLILLITRRKRRLKRILHGRYAKYPRFYRYR